MLSSISIQNIALISDLTMQLEPGLNVITGETGAGKSLLIDSISLLLGDKADRSLISYNKDYALVEAVFATDNNKILDILEEFGLERENQIVVSRKLYKEGKNECRVNGKVFTLSMLKKLTSPLMDLHGQFEHQSILDAQNQLAIIDGLGGESLLKLKQNYQQLHGQYAQVCAQLNSFTEDDQERNRLIDLYDYQIEEITNADFKEGEEESLKEYRQKVLNLEKIASALEASEQLSEYGLDGSGGIVETLSRLMGLLANVKVYDKQIEELYNRVDSIKIEVADIADSITSVKDSLEYNEAEAKENEQRVDLLSSFKKKYGKDITAINEYLDKISAEANRLKNAEDYIAKLKVEKQNLLASMAKVGGQLSDLRKQVAQNLEQKIKAELASLAMKNTTFMVQFTTLTPQESGDSGIDQVEYMFSANSGQPAKPLSKVISGGEMSRFMLAVKNITADIENIDTMIFDEIDTGVSGFVAEELAKKLLCIGVKHQVICVSHLSQVASFATHHYYISKQTTNGQTHTSLKTLSRTERVTEVARLIGGTITEHSLQHSKLMLANADNYLKQIAGKQQ